MNKIVIISDEHRAKEWARSLQLTAQITHKKKLLEGFKILYNSSDLA